MVTFLKNYVTTVYIQTQSSFCCKIDKQTSSAFLMYYMEWFFLKGDSVQFSHSVMSDSLWPHEPQHTRPPCPSPTPRVPLNPCPSSWWCHPTILSSVILFSSCPQSFPASGCFPMSQSALYISWQKYWSFSFSISSSDEYSGLISFRIDWFNLLAVWGTLKSLL